MGMIIPIFVSQSPKGRCYGNQLNLEDGRRRRQERPLGLLLASAFDNGLADRKSAFKRLNGNIRATLCTYLVNLHPIISVNFSRVIGNHFCTSCRNLVRFGSLTPEFKTYA